MNTKHTVPTDQKKEIIVDSQLAYVMWSHGRAYAGFEAEFEVKTSLAGNGAKVKGICITEKGKKLGKFEGALVNNRFRGKVLIPETVKPDDYIYLEVELPKLNLSGESNCIPVRPCLQASSIMWSKKKIQRDDEVKLTCVFTNGVEEGDGATVIVYEYDSKGYHDSVVILPTVIKNSKVELNWKFIYQEDTGGIPTDAEMKKYGGKYHPPEYFFVVKIDGIPVGNGQEGGLLVFRDKIKITIQHGLVPPDEKLKYTITFADGTSVSRTADKNRRIVIDDAPPGRFTILPENWPRSDTVTGKTGTPLHAIFPDTCPLIDAHMHIQSNNCCPLPLQWAILAEKAGLIKGRPSEDNRKKMNDTTAGVLGSVFAGRLGKIGRLSTDMISQLYTRKLYDSDMKQEVCWTVLSDKEMKKYENNEEEMRKIAGREAKLSSLTAKSTEEYEEEFIQHTRYYFEATRIHRMNVALLMDLSFGHYWGRSGLPLYLSTGKGMFYINDFAAASIVGREGSGTSVVSLHESVVTPEIYLSPDLGKPGTTDSYSIIHLFPSYSENESAGFSSSSFYTEQFDCFNRKAHSTGRSVPLIRFEAKERVRNILLREDIQTRKKIQLHFVAKAPGEDPARFEDYALQRELSIAAAIMNPISLFAFYHYDPRRHCISKERTPEKIASKILGEHAFFTLQENSTHTISHNNHTYSGCIDALEHGELNNPALLTEIIGKHLRSNKDALAELHLYDTSGPGVFWGVKMYPRLGYSPSDFKNYPELANFYKECEAKGIPITAHCGPGGMSIADYYLYERYDEHRNLDLQDKDGHYNLEHAAKRFDGVVGGSTGKDSPARWEEVLEKHPKLKLNLAHFGSSDTWKDCAGFKKADDELAKRINGKSKKYDKYDRYRDWTRKIAELVNNPDYGNVYTDISYFVNDDPSWFFGAGHDRDDVAEDLVYLLKKYKALKDRLLMGSDWYMIEVEGEKGVGDYFRKMFYMLRTVSKEVGYDAWYQFTVVNPLRFLGLVDEKVGGEGPFKVDTKKLEGLKGKFEGRVGDTKWKKKTGCKIKPEQVQKSFDETILLLKNIQILSGDKIVRNNALTILQSIK